ncbi:MAG: endonuclease/exonuclease/phosphatase family protein [Thermoanaerobaculia bacterium]
MKTASASSRPRDVLTKVLVLAIFGVWALGQMARDRTLLTAWAFYLPSIVVAALLASLSLTAAIRRRFRAAGLLILLALFPAGVCLLIENRWMAGGEVAAMSTASATSGATGQDVLRVAAWNVADFPRGVERAAAILRPLAPDLIVLSEAPGRPPQELERRLGGALRLTPVGAMAILARGEIGDVEWLERDRELQAAIVSWTIDGRKLAVMAVNVISSPRVPRHPLLQRIVEMIARRSPDLAVGDFNAPRRSLALSTLPAGFRHAYDAAGSGWSATWPSALPLLAIDQTIVGPRLAVRRYALRTSRISDHRVQVTDLVFRMPPAPGSG